MTTDQIILPWKLEQQWLSDWPLDDKQRQLCRHSREGAIEAAVSAGFVEADAAAGWWATQAGLERFNGTLDVASAAALADLVNYEFAIDHLLLLIGKDEQGYTCLTARPWHWQALDNLSLKLNSPLKLLIVAELQLKDWIGKVYNQLMAQSSAVSQATAETKDSDADEELRQGARKLSDRELLATAEKEPVAKLVDVLLFDATQKKASDLHVHPYPDSVQIRYRLDGVLHDVYRLPKHLQDQITGRIKVLAGMDVAEKRLAQDGRTGVQIGSRRVDMRISTLPTTHGERVVIRLLEQTAQLKQLSELGMPKEMEKSFQQAIRRSTGLILVTGPTGSGKTTTLYSALAQLDATAKNILTLEDPVEYKLSGISQTQVAEKKGMTFLSGLRHILRQDPDVVMVGEIRDEPTARMVIQSSLTGHLVLSTLHTNSAAGAVVRLADLGIERFLIGSSLLGVLAQRLVRKVCSTCRGHEPQNCVTCNGTGYSGRTALLEWLVVSQAIRNQILANATAGRIEEAAVAEGMQTLRQQGSCTVKQGLTTEAELMRVLGSAEE